MFRTPVPALFVILFLVSSVAAIETPEATRAASTAGQIAKPATPGKAKDWKTNTEAQCGMACRYHRANDNLTMQALYLVTKIQKVDAGVKGNDQEKVKAKTALGGFCNGSIEALDDCLNRYKSFQRVALLQIRESIGKNEDVIAQLTTGRKADGTVDGTAVTFEANVEREPYIPDVPTLSEMEQAYSQGKLNPTGKKFTGAEIRKWSEELVKSNAKAKHLEFEKESVVGNPYQKEKTGYSLYRVKSSGSGTEKVDAKAEALRKGAIDEIKKVSEYKQFDPQGKPISPKDLKKEDELSYQAFIEARSVINSAVQKDIDKKDVSEKTRTPAGKKDPKASPSGTPSPGPSQLPSAANQNAGAAEDVDVSRKPSGSNDKVYDPEERITRPEGLKNSRYIKYNIHELLKHIESWTSK